MQKDIRLSQRNFIFYTHIFNKYIHQIELQKFPLLNYLLHNRWSKNSYKYTNFLHSLNIDLTLPETKQIMMIRKKSVPSKKNEINTLRLPGQNQASGYKNTVVQKKMDHTTIHTSQYTLSNHQIISKILKKTFNSRLPLNNIQMSKDIKKVLFLHNMTIQNVKGLVFKESVKNRPAIIYDNSHKVVSSRKVPKNKIQTNSVEDSSNDQTILLGQTTKHIGHYEIRKLADKVYPMILKRWQKEFEKREVFYG